MSIHDETIFKREDGSSVLLRVSLQTISSCDRLKPERTFDWNDCTIPKEEFHPSLCAENGMWNEMTGWPCMCTALCKYHKDYRPLEFAGKRIL